MPSHVPSRMVSSLQHAFPFIGRFDSLLYSGTHITPDLKHLYDLNYGPLLTGILKDLQSWRGHLLTWFGRVNALKMKVLPRIIYILYTVPIALPQSFFKQVQRASQVSV